MSTTLDEQWIRYGNDVLTFGDEVLSARFLNGKELFFDPTPVSPTGTSVVWKNINTDVSSWKYLTLDIDQSGNGAGMVWAFDIYNDFMNWTVRSHCLSTVGDKGIRYLRSRGTVTPTFTPTVSTARSYEQDGYELWAFYSNTNFNVPYRYRWVIDRTNNIAHLYMIVLESGNTHYFGYGNIDSFSTIDRIGFLREQDQPRWMTCSNIRIVGYNTRPSF